MTYVIEGRTGPWEIVPVLAAYARSRFANAASGVAVAGLQESRDVNKVDV